MISKEKRRTIRVLSGLATLFFGIGFFLRIVQPLWIKSIWIEGIIGWILGFTILFGIGTEIYSVFTYATERNNTWLKILALIVGLVFLLAISVFFIIMDMNNKPNIGGISNLRTRRPDWQSGQQMLIANPASEYGLPRILPPSFAPLAAARCNAICHLPADRFIAAFGYGRTAQGS